MIKAYVDGAASKNGSSNSMAGWAFVLLDDNNNIITENSGSIVSGTNNMGELTAILKAIKSYLSLKTNEQIIILSDSAYCINGINDWRHKWKKYNWHRDPKESLQVKNKEIWKEIDSNIDEMFMIFEKVQGHSNEKNINAYWNDYVDKKAKLATKQ